MYIGPYKQYIKYLLYSRDFNAERLREWRKFNVRQFYHLSYSRTLNSYKQTQTRLHDVPYGSWWKWKRPNDYHFLQNERKKK